MGENSPNLVTLPLILLLIKRSGSSGSFKDGCKSVEANINYLTLFYVKLCSDKH
jgi:hypothetical protein